MTDVRIDDADPDPPFAQVRRQLARLVETGQIAHDERLPSVRGLAAELGVAPGTVARAYKELEADGVVRTRRGGGTRAWKPVDDRVDVHLRRSAATFVAEVAALGVTAHQARAAVDDAFSDRRDEHGPPSVPPTAQ
ncbi:GntR family transcriptional regulator [Janibacter melonis]|uniref:GntR family transcriptional regulator n=1 Tax=Janibacter melonis TaxID=262209 RepID=UPI00174CEB2B|nr:GntR family transcriptional regulator [Janibacter melonis]